MEKIQFTKRLKLLARIIYRKWIAQTYCESAKKAIHISRTMNTKEIIEFISKYK